MNRRILAPACALALALILPLVGCGGQQSSSTGSAADSTTSATSVLSSDSSSAPVTQETFVGDWVTVKIITNGLTLSGDFSTFDETAHFAVSFAADGTMSMGFSDTSVPGTWKLEGEQVRATLKHADGAEGDMIFTSNGNGTITATSPYGDSNGDLIVFAKSAEGAMDVPVDVTKAKAPTQASQVVGSWKTVGVVMGKVYAEGDNLSQTGSPTISLDLKEDGTGTISYGDSYSASDTKWEIASGACTFEESGKKYNLLVSGDYLIADLGASENATVYVLMQKV